jgi:hypothetical protein
VFPSGETRAIELCLLLLNVCIKLCTELTSVQAVKQKITAMMIFVGPLVNYTYMEPLFSYSVATVPICELCSVSWKLLRFFFSGCNAGASQPSNEVFLLIFYKCSFSKVRSVLPEDGRITETCRSQLIFYCFRHFKLNKINTKCIVGNKQSIDLKTHRSTINTKQMFDGNLPTKFYIQRHCVTPFVIRP